MAKIILSMNGTLIREMALPKRRIMIGRGSQNDIVLDDLAISGHHAAIVTTENDSYLEDLNSTNGTQVNGQPVRKHFLQDDDVIGLARYRIRYLSDFEIESDIAREGERKEPTIKALNGINSGQEMSLTKTLTIIGHPGKQVAVIAKRADGFYLNYIEGEKGLFVDGCAMSAEDYRLKEGQVIELADLQFEFSSRKRK